MIQHSDLDDKDQAIYLDILSNSMFLEEQVFLFWISVFTPDIKRSITNSRLLNQIGYEDCYKNYGLKFHEKMTFRTIGWYEVFDEHLKQKPA